MNWRDTPSLYVAHRLMRARDWQDRPEFGQLCDWWRSGREGVCALVGIGGAGKTAIADRFLRSLLGVLPADDVCKDETLEPPNSLFRLNVRCGDSGLNLYRKGQDRCVWKGIGTTRKDRVLCTKLDQLVEMKLLERDQDARYSVHPAVRNGFLKSLDTEISLQGHRAVRDGLTASLGRRIASSRASGGRIRSDRRGDAPC